MYISNFQFRVLFQIQRTRVVCPPPKHHPCICFRTKPQTPHVREIAPPKFAEQFVLVNLRRFYIMFTQKIGGIQEKTSS